MPAFHWTPRGEVWQASPPLLSPTHHHHDPQPCPAEQMSALVSLFALKFFADWNPDPKPSLLTLDLHHRTKSQTRAITRNLGNKHFKLSLSTLPASSCPVWTQHTHKTFAQLGRRFCLHSSQPEPQLMLMGSRASIQLMTATS